MAIESPRFTYLCLANLDGTEEELRSLTAYAANISHGVLQFFDNNMNLIHAEPNGLWRCLQREGTTLTVSQA